MVTRVKCEDALVEMRDCRSLLMDVAAAVTSFVMCALEGERDSGKGRGVSCGVVVGMGRGMGGGKKGRTMEGFGEGVVW